MWLDPKNCKRMKVVNLGQQNTILNTYVAEIRDARIQKDSMRFRTNLERVGCVFGYEISKTLDYSVKDVTTPLAVAQVSTPDTPLVVAAILRAGLPLQGGLLDVFDRAESAFLSTFRKYGKGDYFKVFADYCTCPDLEGKTLIVADPMLATGGSAVEAISMLKLRGCKNIHFMCIIAAPEGVDLMHKQHPDVDVYIGALDERLNDHGYIVPGLGDAGDRIFGTK